MVIWCRVNFVFSCFVSSRLVRTEECADGGLFASLPKKEAPPNFILFSGDGYICLMVYCVRLLCDVGISCARRLIYPKWVDLFSLVVAFHYNLHISPNTLIPVCLPFAFAFQLSQRQWALWSSRGWSFSRKSSKKKREVAWGGRGSTSVRRAIKQVCDEWCCFPVDACEMCWSCVCTVVTEDVLIIVFVCFGGVMTSTAQSKKLLLIVLRLVVRGGACELAILVVHVHRVIMFWNAKYTQAAYALHCVNLYILVLWVRSFNYVHDAISRSLAFGCRHLCMCVSFDQLWGDLTMSLC